MRGVAEQVGGGEDRPGRDLLGDVLRGDVAHLEIAALQGDELGALLEQGAAVIALEDEVVLDRVGEHLHHLGADVLLREHGREAQLRLVLRERRARRRQRRAGRCRSEVTARRWHVHGLLPVRSFCVVQAVIVRLVACQKVRRQWFVQVNGPAMTSALGASEFSAVMPLPRNGAPSRVDPRLMPVNSSNARTAW